MAHLCGDWTPCPIVEFENVNINKLIRRENNGTSPNSCILHALTIFDLLISSLLIPLRPETPAILINPRPNLPDAAPTSANDIEFWLRRC